MQSLGNFWFNLIFLSLIQCNRLAMIDLIQTLEFLFHLILEIFIQLNTSFFIQSYCDEVVDSFYWGEFSVNHMCCLQFIIIENR